ncbi:HetZ-related protein 2 [Dolichospermum circinale CS-1225]|uniref:HetZ-related protein 2 n=1 Tax=Dolichospermum circinale CS-537/01 TaxID=3021739 RepID=A0ABT5A0X5_9CYAN|nr:HetZ-related protein 2 [Dolichospermum circinale]MDB9458572.1 HetZ-related protein 2 [Dolichospermum circinale CS-545/17]MDB9485549.1 HetZ-related protein 2 [Dolichospermum circinale CS-537/01]MDB9522540.1 HetZ-related protein 2 [Dolichospermum circinale CS-1225]
MTQNGANIAQYWQQRLATECPEQSQANRESIISWLLGIDLNRFNLLNPKELEIAKQAIEYRWRILHKRYLGMSREKAYCQLINRLGSVVTIRNKIQSWISLSRDRQRSVVDVLQEVLQELLQSDSYIQQQMSQISALTTDKRLRDMLLFASIEEYCLRPVRNQPILMYRFVNYLRRIQRGGLTQVPTSELVKLVSQEIITENNDHPVSLIDHQAIAQFEETQYLEEQQANRQLVQEEFAEYLLANIGQLAVDWLQLYLQGKSQEQIAKQLNKPIKQVYRLREKISYHAVRIFAIKRQPELVDNWLSASLKQDNLGLTATEWQQLEEQLTPLAQQVLNLCKAGNSMEEIAQKLQCKTNQILSEWTKIYLAAQKLRTNNYHP